MKSRFEAALEIIPAVDVAAQRLAELTGAEAVLLFGSRARGDHAPGSDWDLCVVLPDSVRHGAFTPLTLWAALADLGIPVQVVPVRRCIFDKKRFDINSMSHDIARDGIVLRGSIEGAVVA